MPHRSNFLPFRELTGLAVSLKVIDAGLGNPGAPPPYAALLDHGSTRVLAIGPKHVALPATDPRVEPVAGCLGDGSPGTVHLCREPGMSSLLEPDPAVLAHIGALAGGAEVTGRMPVSTVRLDDVPEALGVDFLKLDLRGAELDALRNGIERLREAAVLHVAVAFLPLYEGQAMFGEVDLFLRARGFVLHRFEQVEGLVVGAAGKTGRRGAAPSQWLRADAVYIRDLTRLGRCPTSHLVATAAILHDCYGSVDVALRLLVERDRRGDPPVAAAYLAGLQGRPAAQAA